MLQQHVSTMLKSFRNIKMPIMPRQQQEVHDKDQDAVVGNEEEDGDDEPRNESSRSSYLKDNYPCDQIESLQLRRNEFEQVSSLVSRNDKLDDEKSECDNYIIRTPERKRLTTNLIKMKRQWWPPRPRFLQQQQQKQKQKQKQRQQQPRPLLQQPSSLTLPPTIKILPTSCGIIRNLQMIGIFPTS